MSSIDWYQTDNILQEIRHLQAHYPASDAFIANLNLERRLTKAQITVSPAMLAGLKAFVGQLYEMQPFATPPRPLPPDLYYTIEGARRRDILLNLRRTLANPEQKLREFTDIILETFAILVVALPPQTAGVHQITTIRVMNVVDVPNTIADLMRLFLNLPPESLCYDITLQLDENSHLPNGKLRPPVYEIKGDHEEIVSTYLHNTPLIDLFELPVPFSLPDEARFAGHWVIAPPGRGKTTLLHSMFLNDLRQSASIIVMDSKGDLIEPIKALKAVADRLVLIEPDPEFPLALNPLDIPRAGVAHTLSLLEYVMSSLLEAKMTALQTALFRKLLPVFVAAIPNPTLETFRDVLINGIGNYRHHLANLDADIRQFFTDREHGFDSKTYAETRNQLTWRLDFLLSNPVLKAMFASLKTKLDIGKEMDAGKIIIINNSKALLGDEGAEFFGRFFIALILAAAQQRAGRRPEDIGAGSAGCAGRSRDRICDGITLGSRRNARARSGACLGALPPTKRGRGTQDTDDKKLPRTQGRGNTSHKTHSAFYRTGLGAG